MRADEVSTKTGSAQVFLAAGSGRVLSVLLLVAFLGRLVVGRYSLTDLGVLVIAAGLVGPVEWWIHKYLLHGDVDAWSHRRLGIGVGHRQHHLDPADVGFLLLPGRDAGIFALVLGLFAVAWSAPLALVTGTPVPSAAATAALVAWTSLWHYEWVHLLVHTRYRPRSRYYARLARHHRLHHFRNEDYWLGVTSNLGDRLAGTLPADRSAVPLSPTARQLDG